MPVRQRSPSSQGSAAASFAYDDASPTYRTMRSRNPDGSSTVYHVHEGVMMGGAGGGTMSRMPVPPAQYYGGGGGGGAGLDPTYATYMPSSYSPYDSGYPYGVGQYPPQQQRRPNLVFHGDDEDEYVEDGAVDEYDDTEDDGSCVVDDCESRSLVPYDSSSSSAMSSSTRRSRGQWCARNSTPCILAGMISAIGFIVGYVFLIEAIVAHSRASRAATRPVDSSMSPNIGLRGGDAPTLASHAGSHTGSSTQQYVPPVGSALAQQLDLEPRYFVLDQVLRPVGVGEVPPGALSGKSSPSSSRPTEGGSRSIVVAEVGHDESSGEENASQMDGSSSHWTHSIGVDREGSDEPVRRER